MSVIQLQVFFDMNTSHACYSDPAYTVVFNFSKWYLTLEEYPYHLFPPYVTAGAYVLSQPALKDFYYGSYFTKRFKFDDVFLGLVSDYP